MIPDVDPYSLPEGSDFSMAAGDFLEIYSDPGWMTSSGWIFGGNRFNSAAYLTAPLFCFYQPSGTVWPPAFFWTRPATSSLTSRCQQTVKTYRPFE